MTAAEDLAQLVHLEQVAVLPVEPEPPDRESGVVGQLQDVPGIVQTLHQVALYVYFMGMYGNYKYSQKKKQTEKKARLFGARNSFNSIPHYRFSTRMIRRKG